MASRFWKEKVVLGSSNGAIEVEAVNLDKIREKFSNLERLREVSLENELIARADPPGMIRKTCPNIAAELPSLQRLALNRNRLESLLDPQRGATAFNNLLELELNGTLTTWSEFRKITAFMPKIRAVEMGYNRLGKLTSSDSFDSPIQSLNLDTNELLDWNNICDTAKSFPHVEPHRFNPPSCNI
ncbi:hypothetical protein MPER_07563 [Moniliophthora perniciosa FA553]|nr:hypothetical protein MPER_07563 [Moniliophthora perniciosa FA553]